MNVHRQMCWSRSDLGERPKFLDESELVSSAPSKSDSETGAPGQPPRGSPGKQRVMPAFVPGDLSIRKRPRSMPAAVRIRRTLRDGVASLRLAPGAPILEKDLARTYGVSRTPVREAFSKLVEKGLVSVFPQAGTFVSRIPFHDLPEALVIRRSLEETSARFAAGQGRADCVAEASAEARTVVAEGATRPSTPQWRRRSAIRACGSSPSRRNSRSTAFGASPCRRPGASRARAEHEAVLEAIAARDPNAGSGCYGGARRRASRRPWPRRPRPSRAFRHDRALEPGGALKTGQAT